MFKSKSRDIVVPQSEHARLAGLMAFHWGNREFEKTSLPFESFVKGVAFHDRGYPRLDTYPINEMEEEQWLDILKHGASLDFTDNVANIIILQQIKRVALYSETPQRKSFAEEIETRVEELISQSKFSKNDFLFADQITAFCDSVSYKFCFEELCSLELAVQGKQAQSCTTNVSIDFQNAGVIKISPWPFKEAKLSGYLNAYKKESYPEQLDPAILTFEISPNSSDW